MNNKKINKLIKKYTNNEYIFQDYVFIIKRSSIHTCHRDSNGDFFNADQKYPSYTILFFLEDIACFIFDWIFESELFGELIPTS